MKKYYRIIVLGIFAITYGCSNDNKPTLNAEESFLPMQIGNYWKNDNHNYVKIVDTLTIQGNLYYKFYSITGGDAIGILYLRIDNEKNLVEAAPEYPDYKYLHAKFNADLGSTFWTINDQSVNDFKVTITKKETSLRTFEFQRVYHPNATDKHSVTYIKGQGWTGYKEIKISGNVFKF